MSNLTDLTFLENFAGGDKTKMAKYINMFLQYAPSLINTMEAKLAEGNYNELRVAAHSLKPQITYMGIKNQESNIKLIEHMAADMDHVENLPGLIAGFKEEVEKSYEELRNHLIQLK